MNNHSDLESPELQEQPEQVKSVRKVPSKPLTGGDYWEVIGEIDFLYFELEQTVKRVAKRPPIVRMIDEATGYDKQRFDDVKTIVARIKELQAMLPPDDPHFKANTELSQQDTRSTKAKKGVRKNA